MDPRRNVAGDPGSPHTLSLPLLPVSAPRLRRWLEARLADAQVPARARADLLSAAEEAVVNAVVHSGDQGGAVEVAVFVLDGRVELTVTDHGGGFDPSAIDVKHAPDPLESHGRGLFLVHALMDHVDIASSGQGTVVRMVRRIDRSA